MVAEPIYQICLLQQKKTSLLAASIIDFQTDVVQVGGGTWCVLLPHRPLA